LKDKLMTSKRKNCSSQAPTKLSLSKSSRKSKRNLNALNARSMNSILTSPSSAMNQLRFPSFKNLKRNSSSVLLFGTTAMSSINCKRSGFQIRLEIRMPMKSSKLYASTTPRTQRFAELSSESMRKTKYWRRLLLKSSKSKSKLG